ncbi:hypothetical protein ACLMJK_002689 [Lecanora helva]
MGFHIDQASGKSTIDSSIIPTNPSFLTRAAQALVSGRYDNARPYAVEALVLYGICKFSETKDRDTNAWMIMGLSARLAMRMGYHRDPRHLSTITPFEGEMRRRTWMIVETFDLLLSSQAGLPAIIHEEEYDTRPPSNLFDEDFDEKCEALPSSRPPTDATPMLYYRFKGQLAKLLRRVFRHALSLRARSYEDCLEIDHQLHEMHKQVPPSLQYKKLSSSIMDETYLIMWRLNVDLLYQRSLCVLHREYISHHRSNSIFDYSRETCTNAALRILEHQVELHSACGKGGRLHHDQWMFSSLIFNDFLLAAMIICLDLYEFYHSPRSTSAETPTAKLRALKLSYEIWTSREGCSRDARRAVKFFEVMISKLPRFDWSRSNMLQEESANGSMNGTNLMGSSTEPSTDIDFGAASNLSSLDDVGLVEPLETLFTDFDNINWGVFDQYFHDRGDTNGLSPDLHLFDCLGPSPIQ